MSGISRRKFLGSSAALPLGLGLAAGASAQSGSLTGSASMIVTGAKVLTMDWDQPLAEAIAIRGDRILHFANASTVRIDGRGTTVTPGFIDAHSHPLFAEEAVGVNVNLRRIDDVKVALAGKAANTPPGHWVSAIAVGIPVSLIRRRWKLRA